MRTHLTSRLARLALVSAATAALAVTATACDADTASHASAGQTRTSDGAAAPDSTSTPAGSSDSAGKGEQGSPPVAGAPVSKGAVPAGRSGAAAGSKKSGAPAHGGSGVQQSCGADDLTWKVTPKSQQGGYLEISVRANPGITCWLPEDLPMVAFGSRGIQAQPAEQSVGVPIRLTGSRTAYAGINPKTTKDDSGTEFQDAVLATDSSDTTSVEVHTGPVLVDDPIVTNWHTDPADVVPGTGLDSD